MLRGRATGMAGRPPSSAPLQHERGPCQWPSHLRQCFTASPSPPCARFHCLVTVWPASHHDVCCTVWSPFVLLATIRFGPAGSPWSACQHRMVSMSVSRQLTQPALNDIHLPPTLDTPQSPPVALTGAPATSPYSPSPRVFHYRTTPTAGHICILM